MSSPLDSLNPEQAAAVTHAGGPLVVLAGPGSGKTRVIAARVAHLLTGDPRGSVVAMTFTNRAAAEMRARVVALVGGVATRLFVGTFHAWGLRCLRTYADKAGLRRGFAVYDRADQIEVIKACAEGDAEGDVGAWARRSLEVVTRSRNQMRPLEPVGLRYLAALRAQSAVDFDDLLLLPLELLRAEPDLRARLAPDHLLVDEFQDTSPAQSALLEALWPGTGDVTVVGDDDQAIYGFRGATVENILRFAAAHPGTRTVRLVKSYRSTAAILGAAQALARNNRGRLGKTAVADRGSGELVRLLEAATAEAEADAVAAAIAGMVGRFGGDEVAILYRTNAQSRLIEEALTRRRIAHHLIKGQRFFERREVKDLIAYLRLLAAPDDRAAFLRVVNVPARGIGAAALDELEVAMREHAGAPSIAAAAVASSGSAIGRRLGAFLDLLGRLRERAGKLGPGDVVRMIVRETGYDRVLAAVAEGEERRAENVEELARKGDALAGVGEEALQCFLDDVAVTADPESAGAAGVALMTLHNAKGLEFRGVVVAGVEEGLLPYGSSAEDVEEERRLLYVGMTRAKDELVLSYSLGRRLWSDDSMSRPSRFLAELPREHLHTRDARPAVTVAAPASATAPVAPRRPGVAPPPEREAFAVGGWVRHAQYGEGMVLEREGSGDAMKLTVRFASGMRKKLVAKFAGLREVRRAGK